MVTRTIGRGEAAYNFGTVTGRTRFFAEAQDVIEAFDSDLDKTIAVVQEGGTTFLSPIFGSLAGVICMSGTTRSHLAIIAREFGIPCVLSVDLDEPIADDISITLEAVSDAVANVVVSD